MEISHRGRQIVQGVEKQVLSRMFRASNELRNASLFVLRGQRSGRRYRVPFTGGRKRKARYYVASAPGEAPANRTGVFRLSWRQRSKAEARAGKVVVRPGIVTLYEKIAGYLDKGTPGGKIKPRPFSEPIKARAWPRITRIYREPYV